MYRIIQVVPSTDWTPELRLSGPDAKALLDAIRTTGEWNLGDHAVKEMEKDDLDMQDARNVLRGGVVQEPEFENGEWRYQVRTSKMTFVIAFESRTRFAVVTAWRNKR